MYVECSVNSRRSLYHKKLSTNQFIHENCTSGHVTSSFEIYFVKLDELDKARGAKH